MATEVKLNVPLGHSGYSRDTGASFEKLREVFPHLDMLYINTKWAFAGPRGDLFITVTISVFEKKEGQDSSRVEEFCLGFNDVARMARGQFISIIKTDRGCYSESLPTLFEVAISAPARTSAGPMSSSGRTPL